MGERSVRQGAIGEQADLPVDRLLDVPLVPRDGAGILRERRHRACIERALRVDQGRPRGAPGCRPCLHDVRAGHDRIRRVADERLADAGAEAVLRRHVLSALVEMGQARVCRDPAGDHPGVAGRPRKGGGIGRARHRTAPRQRSPSRRVDAAWRHCAAAHRRAVPPVVRRGPRRIRRRAEVPQAKRAPVPLARACQDRRCRRGADGPGDAAGDGARRHARPRGRRFSSLFSRRRLARPAFREDAVRPGAARPGVCRGGPGVRRRRLAECGRRHAELRPARDDAP